MQPRAVDFIYLNVSDMRRAIGFYRDTLGLTPTADEWSSEFPDWAEFAVGSSTLGLCGPAYEPPPEPGSRGGATVALAVEDVATAVAELREKGVAILAEPFESPVCHGAIIADPDGNRIMLHRRKDGTFG